MTYEIQNAGALFNNSRKEKETHPDFNGSINVEGVDYWISGWKKKDRNEKTYVSLSVKRKEQAPAPRPAPQRPQQRPAPTRDFGDDFDDGFR